MCHMPTEIISAQEHHDDNRRGLHGMQQPAPHGLGEKTGTHKTGTHNRNDKVAHGATGTRKTLLPFGFGPGKKDISHNTTTAQMDMRVTNPGQKKPVN